MMNSDDAQIAARELVETRIQQGELQRLNLLNQLREHEAQLSILKARADADTAALVQQLTGG